MGSRFLITGVQIGMLLAFYDYSKESGKELLKDILENQYLYDSNEPIENDIEQIKNEF